MLWSKRQSSFDSPHTAHSGSHSGVGSSRVGPASTDSSVYKPVESGFEMWRRMSFRMAQSSPTSSCAPLLKWHQCCWSIHVSCQSRMLSLQLLLRKQVTEFAMTPGDAAQKISLFLRLVVIPWQHIMQVPDCSQSLFSQHFHHLQLSRFQPPDLCRWRLSLSERDRRLNALISSPVNWAGSAGPKLIVTL